MKIYCASITWILQMSTTFISLVQISYTLVSIVLALIVDTLQASILPTFTLNPYTALIISLSNRKRIF